MHMEYCGLLRMDEKHDLDRKHHPLTGMLGSRLIGVYSAPNGTTLFVASRRLFGQTFQDRRMASASSSCWNASAMAVARSSARRGRRGAPSTRFCRHKGMVGIKRGLSERGNRHVETSQSVPVHTQR